MRTISYNQLRKNLVATLDRVTEHHEPVVIMRDRGKPAAVLISLENFASYEETAHLMKSPRIAKRLRVRRLGTCGRVVAVRLKARVPAGSASPS